MTSHFIPVIKNDEQHLFMLIQTYESKTWVAFEDIQHPDETDVECAIRCGKEQTFGVINSKNKKPFYTASKQYDFFCFMETDVSYEFAEYLNRMLSFSLHKKRTAHKDDIIKVRWFTLDEIFSFKDVSPDLLSLLSVDLHKFRNGLHSLGQSSSQALPQNN